MGKQVANRSGRAADPHWTPELVRSRIQISKLLNRLSDCAQGKVRLTADRLKSIELLLAKSLPNLNAVDVTLDGHATVNVISDKPRSITEWEADAAHYLESSTGTSVALSPMPSP